jgi:hypothetical protein
MATTEKPARAVCSEDISRGFIGKATTEMMGRLVKMVPVVPAVAAVAVAEKDSSTAKAGVVLVAAVVPVVAGANRVKVETREGPP